MLHSFTLASSPSSWLSMYTSPLSFVCCVAMEKSIKDEFFSLSLSLSLLPSFSTFASFSDIYSLLNRCCRRRCVPEVVDYDVTERHEKYAKDASCQCASRLLGSFQRDRSYVALLSFSRGLFWILCERQCWFAVNTGILPNEGGLLKHAFVNLLLPCWRLFAKTATGKWRFDI